MVALRGVRESGRGEAGGGGSGGDRWPCHPPLFLCPRLRCVLCAVRCALCAALCAACWLLLLLRSSSAAVLRRAQATGDGRWALDDGRM